jgi:hypothetical protein
MRCSGIGGQIGYRLKTGSSSELTVYKGNNKTITTRRSKSIKTQSMRISDDFELVQKPFDKFAEAAAVAPAAAAAPAAEVQKLKS